jgi:excinuclease ABC subunit A
VDGQVRDLAEDIALDKKKKHDVEIVVDRLVLPVEDADEETRLADRSRLADSIETALKLGEGIVVVQDIAGEARTFSEHFACP